MRWATDDDGSEEQTKIPECFYCQRPMFGYATGDEETCICPEDDPPLNEQESYDLSSYMVIKDG